MLPYFPAVLRDELLYGVLARLGRYLPSSGPGAAMRSLFGRVSAIASPSIAVAS